MSRYYLIVFLVLTLWKTSCGAIEEENLGIFPPNYEQMSLKKHSSSPPILPPPLEVILWNSPTAQKRLVTVPEDIWVRILNFFKIREALPLSLTSRHLNCIFWKNPIIQKWKRVDLLNEQIFSVICPNRFTRLVPSLETPEAKQEKVQELANLKREQKKLLSWVESQKNHLPDDSYDNSLNEVIQCAADYDVLMKRQVEALIEKTEDDPSCCPAPGLFEDLSYLAQQTGAVLRVPAMTFYRGYKKLVRNKYFTVGSTILLGTTFFIAGYSIYQSLMMPGQEAFDTFYNQSSITQNFIKSLGFSGCPGGESNCYENCMGGTAWGYYRNEPTYIYLDSKMNHICEGHDRPGNITGWLNFVQERCGCNPSFWVERINAIMKGSPHNLSENVCSKNLDNVSICCGRIWLPSEKHCAGDVCMNVIKGSAQCARGVAFSKYRIYSSVTGTFFALYTIVMIASFFYI